MIDVLKCVIMFNCAYTPCALLNIERHRFPMLTQGKYIPKVNNMNLQFSLNIISDNMLLAVEIFQTFHTENCNII